MTTTYSQKDFIFTTIPVSLDNKKLMQAMHNKTMQNDNYEQAVLF